MIYLLKTFNGREYKLNQKSRDAIADLLMAGKEKRPDFIEIKSENVIIATSTIATIELLKSDPQPLPTPAEELEEFNKQWKQNKAIQ